MLNKDTVEGKIIYRIKRSKAPVFVREDFKDIGDYDQVGRILKKLVGNPGPFQIIFSSIAGCIQAVHYLLKK